jgi:hypothetical protein
MSVCDIISTSISFAYNFHSQFRTDASDGTDRVLTYAAEKAKTVTNPANTIGSFIRVGPKNDHAQHPRLGTARETFCTSRQLTLSGVAYKVQGFYLSLTNWRARRLAPPERERYALGVPLARFRLSAAQPLKDLEHCIWFDVWEPGVERRSLSFVSTRWPHLII